MSDLTENYFKCLELLPQGVDVFSSQEGEDVLVRRLLKTLYNSGGAFVDIGAHDPVRFSSTFHYYLRGWRGINVEPNPVGISRFNELRPGDINICCGVSSTADSIEYYKFKEPAFNTTCSKQVDFALTKTDLIETVEINVLPLRDILQENHQLFSDNTVWFLNIDVEGTELCVLNSNDWERFRPVLVLVEALNSTAEKEIAEYMREQNYFFVARTKNTFFYAESTFKQEYVD